MRHHCAVAFLAFLCIPHYPSWSRIFGGHHDRKRHKKHPAWGNKFCGTADRYSCSWWSWVSGTQLCLRSARPSSHGSKRLHRVYHKKYDIWVCQEIGYTVYHQNYRKKKQTRCSDNENIMQMMINSQIWGYIPYVFEKKQESAKHKETCSISECFTYANFKSTTQTELRRLLILLHFCWGRTVRVYLSI